MLMCKGVKMRVLISLLLAPCLVLGVRTIRESIPMQTLQCYNDYVSLTTCTWMECSEAHEFLNVTLNFNNSYEKNKEMTCRSHTGENHADCQNSTMHWVCHINEYDQENYNFKFDLTLQAELNVYLFQNVQTPPPQNLLVSLMTSGDFLLTWKADDGSQGLGSALEYEVTYKREWESWEEAASLLLSNTTSCHLHLKDLVPGSSYVARVRARPGQASGFSGQYSEWSTEVSWQTPEGGLHPSNLRCLFNGADRLMCSWEVKKVITTSVLFGLFFRATPASAEEECSPVHEKTLPHVPYVVQSCEIPVNNSSSQSQYRVSVRAKTEKKLIEAYKNIKVLPPTNVSITVTENQEYELRWTKHTFEYDFIKQRYQVEYWKNNQYEKTAEKLNIVNDEPPFIFTLQMLASSTEYRGRMRARVNMAQDYEGPWSEWSEEFTWKTENVLPPVVLPAMLPALIIILLIVAYCSYRYFLRKKQMWEEKIPNPSKSILIQSYQGEVVSQQPASQVGFNGQSTSEEVEQVSCLQVLDGMMKSSPAEFHGAEGKTVQVSQATLAPQNSCQTSEVPHKTSFSSSALICPLNQTVGPSCLCARLPSKCEAHASTASKTCFAFNGPYLCSPVVSSQPDVHQTLEVDPVGAHEKSVSLQYVTLPKENCSQPPQRQEQPAAGPPQPFLLPDQKEVTRHIDDEKEVSMASPTCGKVMDMRTEEQKSPKALGCIRSPQQCPLEYITTESLLPPSASDSTHPPLVTAGELPCDSQEPQPSSDHSCHEFFPGKTGVTAPVSAWNDGGSISGKEDNAQDIEVIQIFNMLKKAAVERKVASSEIQKSLLDQQQS
ncbi:cytokine receptor common subunit beta-like [Limosa lapponica baueri]|uniref:Cytokine receptor common subunit beta-like n=1 Tax=Limosa lapponica baueri TaxID=1758121 RepID=A0A2I0USS3_LIMLA|nr:cytokine receptor common subunit beta-like [Limosa lapponica baueri]